ncbi:hypothetical protein OF83DRAFT_719984 [Amylostereum chailletii]|nr:hypothetical protein OF83DRAFT_719984 [Amylostereum chailletii]
MSFRLPSHLDSFIPPPTEQVPPMRPWSGTLSLTFVTNSQGAPQDIQVTTADADGENRNDLWPNRLFVYISQHRVTRADVSAWVKSHNPPVCAFMPDKHPVSSNTASNQANFASLSRFLLENHMVAYAPWNIPDRLPGAGIMLYPSPSSHALLIGAIFLSSPFPEFIAYSQPATSRVSPLNTVPAPMPFFQQPHAYGQPGPSSQHYFQYPGAYYPP